MYYLYIYSHININLYIQSYYKEISHVFRMISHSIQYQHYCNNKITSSYIVYSMDSVSGPVPIMLHTFTHLILTVLTYREVTIHRRITKAQVQVTCPRSQGQRTTELVLFELRSDNKALALKYYYYSPTRQPLAMCGY